GLPARQGYEEATGDEVAAEREYGHRRTALDFLLTGEHACGATAHHLRRPAHLARGAGDAGEAGPVWRSCEHEQHIGALEARRAKCCGGRIGRGARRISLCRQSRSRPKHTPFSRYGPFRASGSRNCNCAGAENALSSGQCAQQGDEAAHAVAEVLDRDALVDPVDRLLVILAQDEGYEAIARDSVLPEVVAVRETRDHARNDRRPTQVTGRELADGGHQPGGRVGGRGWEREQRLDP